MTPRLQLLPPQVVHRVLGEAFELLGNPGIRLTDPEPQEMLAAAGAEVKDGIARIPRQLLLRALESAPRQFQLFKRDGQAAVHYGGDAVHFDPGSSCLKILDPETLEARLAAAEDLVRLIKVAETLSELAAQSTAMVCDDVPGELGDLYRLFLVLWYSNKPVITGAFSAQTLQAMIELLQADAGGEETLRNRPRAVFDVCPSPPLNWSDFAAANMLLLARAGVPAEIISMPIAGATAPVTLIGSVVQHAAESLAGITIHQLARSGAPVVWGGAPAILDMRSGTAAMGAIETAMLDSACTQIGKHLGLPTHGYLVATDSRLVDAQAGMESAASALLGALSGINMISGTGMLDSLACHSLEKLVIDAEAIGAAQRVRRGIQVPEQSLAVGTFAQTGLQSDFLKLKETRTGFRTEQYLPSPVISRGESGESGDTFARARQRVRELLEIYRRPHLPEQLEQRLLAIMQRECSKFGMKVLPGVEQHA
jgi:trimethylamine--corrinoid protein Co-methyltransferase